MEYKTLEPNNLKALGVTAPSFNGGGASFYATSSFVYTLFFIAIVTAAFYRYALAGMLRMEASETGIRKSNEIFKRVTLGLLGVFSLFLLLFTVNKGLVTGDVGLSGLAVKGVPVTQQPVTITQPATGKAPFIPRNNDDPAGWGAIQNDAAVRTLLRNLPSGGITINRSVCTTPTQTSCTTVGGLPQESLSMLTSLRNACGGTITVTGGTEAGHKSHGPGLFPVDISLNSPGGLEQCIRSFPKGQDISYCKPGRVYEQFGFLFCDENLGVVHWHVLKK